MGGAQNNHINESNVPSNPGAGSFPKKSSCLDEIEKLKINREERRKRMDDIKKKRTMREENNAALGIKVDVEFQAMVETEVDNVQEMQSVSKQLYLLIN